MRNIFRLVMGGTGAIEAVMGLTIVFFAGTLQTYLATGNLYEPLYLRILGMMDFNIGLAYLLLAFRTDQVRELNRWSAFMRLGLSILFFAEGFFLLKEDSLRFIYQFLGVFDLTLFAMQLWYLIAHPSGSGEISE
ncbi:MAG: hypothetical protein OEY50_08360 [Nitrospinota bacterium]|nr:hypothetical protein [Nitrospinota bacterium]